MLGQLAAVGVITALMAWVLRNRELTLRSATSHTITASELALAGVASAVILALLCWLIYVNTVQGLLDPIEAVATFVDEMTRPSPRMAPPTVKGRDLSTMVRQLDELRLRHLDQAALLRRQREALQQRAPFLSAVQRELAPRGLEAVPGLEFASHLMPAEGVLAGDWFHVLPLEGDFVGVIVGDVAGHGAETGIFALQTKQLVTSALRLGLDPGKALGWMADHLGETDEQFVTCLVAIINAETGSCRFANAGHPAAMLKTADSISLLEATGPLIGPYPGVWATGEERLGDGDVLFCYTDGVPEARDEMGKELGTEGVLDMLIRAPEEVDGLIEFFIEEMKQRAVNVSDDLTMLAVKRMAA